ncbi:MAG: flagellar assembly peptidoglycan hydrolase FlgJ [Thiogranum sp.]
MNPSIIQTDVYTDIQGLSKLRAQARDNSEETLREVAGQFEALFIQMMLKSMRDANLGEGLLDSQHSRTYQSMYDKQIAIDLSKRQGLGLADMMVRQLSRSAEFESDDSAAAAPFGSAHHGLLKSAQGETTPAGKVNAAEGSREGPLEGKVNAAPDWKPDSPEAFVKELWPYAQRTARDLGTRPELLLAQAALETGWGQHVIRGTDGSNSFNLFGIKADTRWQGERAVTETIEFEDGLMRKQRASFRAYASLADSFSDYADFLKTNPRYREALNRAADAPSFARALAEAGYATDPDYSGKINRIMDGERLRDALSGVKDSVPEPLS